MRAPSSFHSSSAVPRSLSAAATSSAGCASIGSTGCISRMENCRAQSLPPLSAARATCGMPPAWRGGAPHFGRGQSGSRGDRLQHHAFERALAQFTDDQAQQEVLLLGRGLFEQLVQLGLAGRGGALALDRLQALESVIDILHGKARVRRGMPIAALQGRIAQRQLALADVAAQPGQRDLDLFGRECAQAIGDDPDLRQPARRRRDRGRRAHDLGEQGHAARITSRLRRAVLAGARARSAACRAAGGGRRSCRSRPSPAGTRRAGSPRAASARTVCSITRGPAKPISAFGLGDHHVADHGEARRHAAHGGVGEHGDERQAALARGR